MLKNEKKYIKYTHKLNKLIGGMINMGVPSRILPSVKITIKKDIIDYMRGLTNGSVTSEVCGKIIRTGPDTFIPYGTEAGRSDGERNMCNITAKKNYAVIWHTHPALSKYYPSYEDLFTLTKTRFAEDVGGTRYNHKIKLSLIFTSHIIWVIKYNGPDVPDADAGRFKEFISATNAELYKFNGAKGIDFSPQIVEYINDIYIPALATAYFSIAIYPYTMDTIVADIENVREDALLP